MAIKAADRIQFAHGQHPVIGKCAAKHTVRGLSADLVNGWALQCPCGKWAAAKWMDVKITAEKACNGICMGATGPSCDCSCGGENHGANHTYS